MSENLEQKTNEETTVVNSDSLITENSGTKAAEIKDTETKEATNSENATIENNGNEPTVNNGTEISEIEDTEANETINEVKKKSKKPLIIALSSILAVIVIIGVALLIVFNSKSAEAKRVDSLISSIGTVTLDSEKKITEAEKEVKALSKDDYDQLDNVGQLEEARKTYDGLVLQSKADIIIKQIDEIGEVNENSENKIKTAREAYDQAESSVQELVTNKDKLEKAENTFYEKKAESVIALINGIGEVNENSENKINEAVKAYNNLPKEAKDKVTNYSTLTAAKNELSAIKKESVKDKMDSAFSKLKKEYDDVNGITFYKPSTMPKYINERSYVLPYIGVHGDLEDSLPNAYLRLAADYYDDDWVFFKNLYINADGERFIKECSSNNIKRDTDKGNVCEYYDAIIDESDITWLKAVANAENATIRFSGKYNYDLKLSDSDKQAIQQVVEAYEAVTEYAAFDVNEIINN